MNDETLFCGVKNMKLNDKIVDNENDILAMLDKVASGEEEFAILAKSPKRFIQTSGNMLEYNSGQKLYSAENISNEDISAIMRSESKEEMRIFLSPLP